MFTIKTTDWKMTAAKILCKTKTGKNKTLSHRMKLLQHCFSKFSIYTWKPFEGFLNHYFIFLSARNINDKVVSP